MGQEPRPAEPPDGSTLRRFEQFYRDNISALSRYVARRVPTSSRDEVVAAAFVAAWKKFASVDAPSLPWLYRIASFEVSHERRRLGRTPVSVELPDLRATDEFDVEDVIDISKAFTALSPSDQEVLRLIYWEGLSRSDAAEVLGCSVNALNVRLHRAQARLRATVPSHVSFSDSSAPHVPQFKEES